jgi:hypothetical protein
MKRFISRRSLLTGWAGLALAGIARSATASAQQKIPIVVYKDKNCGCCGKWVEHMAANGFAPTVHDHPDMEAIKRQYHVPARLGSCHTSIAGEYVIEGHVPASDVKKLLSQKRLGIIGLTIPGMPQSAPGMDVRPFQPYTVLTFDAVGNTGVFAEHEA